MTTDGANEHDPTDPVTRGRRGAEDLLGRIQSFADDDPRLHAGVEHFQRAAREVISASRALLDLAEELVEDPGAVRSVAGFVGEIGDVAGLLGARRPRSHVRSSDGEPSDDDEPPVQRIPVS